MTRLSETVGHTPGPWRVGPPDENGEVAVVTDGGYLVTYAFPNGDDCREANARLIAAAPELLEALGWFVDDERFVVSVGGNPAVVEEMIEHASDIYRKARGGAA